jgi:hypothetical protein
MILLLKPNDIPRLTSLNGNIDIDAIAPHVFTAQINDVRRILGVNLYDKIVSDYDSETLENEYATIYNDYVLMILAYYSAFYFIQFGGYKIVNNGIVKMNIEGGTTVDMKEISILANKYKEMAVTYEMELNKYLAKVTIPEYNVSNRKENKLKEWY